MLNSIPALFFLKKCTVSSCGYIQQDGRTSPPEAISTAKKFGVDLSGHRAHHITEDMMQTADLVLVFDESNLNTLGEKFPQNKSKIWFLSEIYPDIPRDIEDPFRKDCRTYEKVFSEIVWCIDKINQEISR